MPSRACLEAIADALKHGRALLKVLSANDAGATGSHQAGFYLPKRIGRLISPFAPVAGRLDKHPIRIVWPDRVERESVITWYGQRTRSEYRVTKFGREFPFLKEDQVGDLLVLVPTGADSFVAHLLAFEEDFLEVQAALGVELLDSWAIYDRGGSPRAADEDDCVVRAIAAFAEGRDAFPSGEEFSEAARSVLARCVEKFPRLSPDARLLRCVEVEYALFRSVEARLCKAEVSKGFDSIDEFIATAGSIMNRRKSRAGRSLENHLERILREAKIPLDARPMILGRPDFVIPGKAAYDDPEYPDECLFVMGVKTTCKDRWGQVVKEAPRAKRKYIFTLQQGIARGQLDEMNAAGVSLVVPAPLHSLYPRPHDIEILTLAEFIARVENSMRRAAI